MDALSKENWRHSFCKGSSFPKVTFCIPFVSNLLVSALEANKCQERTGRQSGLKVKGQNDLMHLELIMVSGAEQLILGLGFIQIVSVEWKDTRYNHVPPEHPLLHIH